MAAVTAAAGALAVASASPSVASGSNSRRRLPAPKGGVRRLALHGGLKAQNRVMAMGVGASTEQQFAHLRALCRARSSSKGSGGALASKCDLAGEIFPIIPIMSALVLVGIAIGFLLLRIEAALEESE